MKDTAGLEGVIGMIMENPTIMGEIKRIRDGEGELEAEPTSEPEMAVAKPEGGREKLERRHRLINVIKEYLSPERARAVDTMVSIFDIIDLAGGK